MCHDQTVRVVEGTAETHLPLRHGPNLLVSPQAGDGRRRLGVFERRRELSCVSYFDPITACGLPGLCSGLSRMVLSWASCSDVRVVGAPEYMTTALVATAGCGWGGGGSMGRGGR